MALTSTMYRFAVNVSDVDRGVYEQFDERVAMHPSESTAYLLTRVLAFALELRPGLTFGRGLAFPDEPTISAPSGQGGVGLWVEIGMPSAARLHKVAKLADEVRVYTYRDLALVLRELAGSTIHRAGEIEFVGFAPALLNGLGELLDRRNEWSVTRSEGIVYVEAGGRTLESTLERGRL